MMASWEQTVRARNVIRQSVMTNGTSKEPALLRIARWADSVGRDHGDHAWIAEDAFVDTLACMAAGVGEPVTERLIDAFGESGRGQSVILFTNATSAPATAALVNATAAHATELDDWDNATEAHMSAVIVPALLAVSESRRTSGAALIDAFLIGLEVGMICGEAINPGHLYGGWHPTSTIGSLGAAAACARLLGLDEARMAHAISLATTNAGLKCQVGTMAKPMFAGTAAQCGVQSALMAAAGITASLDALDGPNGVEAIRSSGQTDGFDEALQGLYRSRWIDRFALNRKPYPTCGIVHRPIDGIVSLMTEHRLRSRDIARVDVRLSQIEHDYCGISRPANVDEARFSVAFGVARTIADGQTSRGTSGPRDAEGRRLQDGARQGSCGHSRKPVRRGALSPCPGRDCSSGRPERSDIGPLRERLAGEPAVAGGHTREVQGQRWCGAGRFGRGHSAGCSEGSPECADARGSAAALLPGVRSPEPKELMRRCGAASSRFGLAGRAPWEA